jgi:ankyrin repeat protein
MNNNIFDLIKSQKFNKISKLITNNKITNLDIKDSNNNYFIQYIINYNQYKLLKLILNKMKKNILTLRLDILDIDGRSILYNCIKFNYSEMFALLIESNKDNIGISIVDIKDKLGLTALHYSIIFNNFEAFKYLLDNNANPYLIYNDCNNVFHIILKYKHLHMLKYLLDNKYLLEFYDINGNTFLQNSIIESATTDIIIEIMKKTLNLNNKNSKYGLTAIHQTVLYNNYDVFKLLIDKNIDINISDFYGNTPLHYILYEKHIDYIDLFNKKAIYILIRDYCGYDKKYIVNVLNVIKIFFYKKYNYYLNHGHIN